jgi:hypothetical protein
MAVHKRSKSTTRSASRKAAGRKRAAPKARATRRLHKISKTTRTTVFRDLQKVLDKHRVDGSISEIHLSSSTAAAPPPPPPPAGSMARAAPMPAPAPCPPNQILKVVCRRNSKGEMHCTEECRPV